MMEVRKDIIVVEIDDYGAVNYVFKEFTNNAGQQDWCVVSCKGLICLISNTEVMCVFQVEGSFPESTDF